MSVKRIVARTRSGSGPWRTPVRNSSTSLTIASWSPHPGQVVVALELHVGRARDALGHVAGAFDRQAPVARPVDDQRRGLHGGKDVSDIDRPVHHCERLGGARACAHPQVGGPPARERRVVHAARRPDRQADRAAPVAPHLVHERLVLIRSSGPGLIRRPEPAGVRTHHDQRRGPLRVGGAEEQAHRPAFGAPHQGGAFRADRVHHGAHIVHPLVERRKLGVRDTVGEPGAAFVEEDQA